MVVITMVNLFFPIVSCVHIYYSSSLLKRHPHNPPIALYYCQFPKNVFLCGYNFTYAFHPL